MSLSVRGEPDSAIDTVSCCAGWCPHEWAPILADAEDMRRWGDPGAAGPGHDRVS